MKGANFFSYLFGGDDGAFTCPKCGSAMNPEHKFCERCGFEIPATAEKELWDCDACNERGISSKFCPNCGKARPEPEKPWTCPTCKVTALTSEFCPHCGTKKPIEVPAPEPKEKKESEPKKSEPEEKKPKTWVCKNPACTERTELPEKFSACPYCGHEKPKEKKPEEPKKCPKCGKPVDDKFAFCPYCKTPLKS